MLNCKAQFLMRHLLHSENCPTGFGSEYSAIKIKQAAIFETEIMNLESMLKHTKLQYDIDFAVFLRVFSDS